MEGPASHGFEIAQVPEIDTGRPSTTVIGLDAISIVRDVCRKETRDTAGADLAIQVLIGAEVDRETDLATGEASRLVIKATIIEDGAARDHGQKSAPSRDATGLQGKETRRHISSQQYCITYQHVTCINLFKTFVCTNRVQREL